VVCIVIMIHLSIYSTVVRVRVCGLAYRRLPVGRDVSVCVGASQAANVACVLFHRNAVSVCVSVCVCVFVPLHVHALVFRYGSVIVYYRALR